MQKQKQFSFEAVFRGTIDAKVVDDKILKNLKDNFGITLGEVQTDVLNNQLINWSICSTPEVTIKEINITKQES